MFYLIGQIALTIFFTALIGITMGWLLRGLGASRQTDAIEARWRARIAQLQQRSGAAREGSAQADTPEHQVIAGLKEQIRQRDEVLASLRSAQDANGERHPDAGNLTQLQELTGRCNQLQRQAAEQKQAAEQLETQLGQSKKEREMLIERLRDRESEIGRMSQERQHAINTIASLQREMRQLRGARSGRADTPAAGVGPAPQTGPEVRTQPAGQATGNTTATAQRPAAPAPAPGPQAPSPQPGPDKQQSLPIAGNAGPRPKPAYEPTWRLSSPRGQKDNLQAIFGIGPKLEMQLNKLGIFHFEQIGRFESNDILWVARHLKSFPGRIVRDRWIEQAQTLSNQRRD